MPDTAAEQRREWLSVLGVGSTSTEPLDELRLVQMVQAFAAADASSDHSFTFATLVSTMPDKVCARGGVLQGCHRAALHGCAGLRLCALRRLTE